MSLIWHFRYISICMAIKWNIYLRFNQPLKCNYSIHIGTQKKNISIIVILTINVDNNDEVVDAFVRRIGKSKQSFAANMLTNINLWNKSGFELKCPQKKKKQVGDRILCDRKC